MIYRALIAFASMHWRWLAGAASMAFGLLTSRNRPSEARRAQIDMDAQDVQRRVAAIAADRGAEAAHDVVRTTYAEEMEQLDARWQQQASSLTTDPAALAALLVKASGTDKKPC